MVRNGVGVVRAQALPGPIEYTVRPLLSYGAGEGPRPGPGAAGALPPNARALLAAAPARSGTTYDSNGRWSQSHAALYIFDR